MPPFSARMAEGTKLFIYLAFLALIDLYLRPEGNMVNSENKGCSGVLEMACALRTVALCTMSEILGFFFPEIFSALRDMFSNLFRSEIDNE